MKIQFGEKGEVSWDLLVETVGAEEKQEERPNKPPTCTQR